MGSDGSAAAPAVKMEQSNARAVLPLAKPVTGKHLIDANRIALKERRMEIAHQRSTSLMDLIDTHLRERAVSTSPGAATPKFWRNKIGVLLPCSLSDLILTASRRWPLQEVPGL